MSESAAATVSGGSGQESSVGGSNDLLREIERRYAERRPIQHQHWLRAARVIPGGTTRSRFYWPFPLYVGHAEGAYLTDLDGHTYVDCNVGFGSLVAGHRHPRIVASAVAAMEQGPFFGCPTTAEAALAEKIAHHYPGAERVAFLNSGTEATLAALRLARAATGRSTVAKFEGGWHGWHDVSSLSYGDYSGPIEDPRPRPDSTGLAPGSADGVRILPYNSDAALEILRREGDTLAAIIMEPMLAAAGAIPGAKGFVNAVRQLARDKGAVFILDEVITGFRIGVGGCAELYGIKPDLVTFGKAIGGGTPVGALAGRADLMDRVAAGADNRVLMFGTFSGNPVTTAAGSAAIDVYIGDGTNYPRLNRLGATLRQELQRLLAQKGIEGCVTGLGSIWSLHLGATAVSSIRERPHAPAAMRALSGLLAERGVFVTSPAHLGFLSMAHGDKEVSLIVEAHDQALSELQSAGMV
jgi:glutamate-1-semialdehyde 2,1-aminomutase